jgi:hypothetical protein
MKRIVLGFAAACAAVWASVVMSAPMAPVGPADIEGTIEEVSWKEKQEIKGVSVKVGGKMVPVSGSLGVDRTIKAQYNVILTDTVVEKPDSEKDKLYYKSFPSGGRAAVTVYHDADDGYLKKGMRIKVSGYTVGGDEGGVWSSYTKVKILKEPPAENDGSK